MRGVLSASESQNGMTLRVQKHRELAEADPDSVIVTLFRDEYGAVRGWYFSPTSLKKARIDWHSGPDDKLYGSIAIIRAWEIADILNCSLCIVDPEHLWDELSSAP